MSEDPDTAAMTGTVAWTAEGRKAMREKSDLFHGMVSEQEIAWQFGVASRGPRSCAGERHRWEIRPYAMAHRSRSCSP
jgi:hypothetical protein